MIDRKSRCWTMSTALVAAAAALALVFSLSNGLVRAAESDVAPTSWIDHVGCTFFGPERDQYRRVGLAAEAEAAVRRSQLTQSVVAALPTGSMPARSRSRGMLQMDGPISGDSIDEFIFGAMERARITPAPPTSDSEFLRRVTIDLTGRIPTESEADQFLADPSPDKRRQAVERLLNSTQWADRWAMYFGDLVRNTRITAQVNRFPGGRDALHLFLLESLGANKPLDQMVREMLATVGYNDGRPWPGPMITNQTPFASYEQYQEFLRSNPARATAASYLVGGLTTGGPIEDTYDTLATIATRDFLGITHTDCILCHDGAGHLTGLSVWGVEAKRAETWGLSAFFQRVELRRPPRTPPSPNSSNGIVPPVWIVRELTDGLSGRQRAGSYGPTTGGNRPDRVFDGIIEPSYSLSESGGGPQGNETYLQSFARLLTADRQFARAQVNYIWREFFGRGFVEPANQFDLMRLDPNNPPAAPWTVQPSHPELLEFLADGFISSGFDLKWLMREITTSQAYQLSSRYDGAWNPSYDQYFARFQVRRLSAEAMLDAVTLATGVEINYATGSVVGQVPFAMQLPDVQGTPTGRALFSVQAAGFLDAFFRGDREETPRSNEFSILQALQLMNNVGVTQRIQLSASDGALSQLLTLPDDALVGLLYLRVLGRRASEPEFSSGVAYLAGGNRRDRAEDLMWALMNKVDFVFNY